MIKITKIFDGDLVEAKKQRLAQLELEQELGWSIVSPPRSAPDSALRLACQILQKEMEDFYAEDEECDEA